MYLNNFSARVVGGNETDGGYVELSHGQTYQLQLRNNNNRRCDAQVEIDGKTIGTWRLNANSGLTLERPANDNGKFTFYKVGTQEARQAQLNEGDSNLGLVKITFTPEVNVRPIVSLPQYKGPTVDCFSTYNYGLDGGTLTRTCAASSYSATASLGNTRSAGGTGLSGHSSQNFDTVSALEYDYSGQTVIHLRLVCKEDDGIRPLTQFSTPVPPRIG